MKILMILSNPFMTDLRVYNEAKALTDAGHEVTVIVWDRRCEYKSKDVVEGTRLFRLRNNLLMKILPNDLFRNPIWWRKAYKKGLEQRKKGFDFDVVHCHDFDTLKTGIWLKKKTGCKLVYDAHEIFGYMIEDDVPKFLVKYVFSLEKKLIKNVDHIITVNKPLENYFKKISRKPITIVMNCKDIISKSYKSPKNDVFTIVYIGTISKRRFFPDLVNELAKISKIKFLIAAKNERNKAYLQVKNRSLNHENVEFLGTIPFNEVILLTFKANTVINAANPSSIKSKIETPNKLLEAMACGRPIICNKGTYAGEITKKLNCGLVVNYNLKAIRTAVKKLRDEPKLCEKLGKNGLKYALKYYNWDKQKEKLLQVYEKLK